MPKFMTRNIRNQALIALNFVSPLRALHLCESIIKVDRCHSII